MEEVGKEEEKRVEIDTSAPFESVKEAVSLFGGLGYWKRPNLSPQSCMDDLEDIPNVEEEAKQLERDLFLKERETLQVLKELQSTKSIVDQLQLQLHKQESLVDVPSAFDNHHNVLPALNQAQERQQNNQNVYLNSEFEPCAFAALPPNFILQQLQRAKLNLTRTTTDLAHIRASIELYSQNIEKERLSLEKTRERLALKSSKISSLQEELNQTTQKLQLAKHGSDSQADASMGLQQLNSETEQFKKMGEAARTEVSRAISEIEQTKMRIKTAEIRLVAAKKMKEAVRAAEAVALAEIKVISNNEGSSGYVLQKPETVTLSFEEYSSLTHKARGAEEQAKERVIDAMLHVDSANVLKMEILQRVEEATEEVNSSKKALEEALNSVEAANRGKLAVEEALREWRSEHSQKKRIVLNSTKFKNSYPSQYRRESCLLDVNGKNLARDGSTPVLKPTLSIGEILSRKLLMPGELETGSLDERSDVKRNVSLGQMLHKQNAELTFDHHVGRENCHWQFSAKRKKFGFGRFSLLLTKQSKKKKKPTLDLR